MKLISNRRGSRSLRVNHVDFGLLATGPLMARSPTCRVRRHGARRAKIDTNLISRRLAERHGCFAKLLNKQLDDWTQAALLHRHDADRPGRNLQIDLDSTKAAAPFREVQDCAGKK